MRRVCMLFTAFLLLIGGGVIAKYIAEDMQEPLYVAKAFYFESDYLVQPIGGSFPQYTLQTGVNEIQFTLKNHVDELRFSEVDIEYKVVLTKDGEMLSQTTTGNLAKNNKSDKKIEFKDLAEGTYIIEATATAPYVKVLKAQFTIVDNKDEICAQVYDAAKSPVLQLTVTSEDYEGEIDIRWPEGVLPDNTDSLLQGVTTNSCKVEIQKYSEYTFQFFKTNPNEVYTNEISGAVITIKK